jgi:hypothetical protein
MLYVQHREKQRPERDTYMMTSPTPRRATARAARGSDTLVSGSLGSRLSGIGTRVHGFDALGSEEALDRQVEQQVERGKS